MRVIHPDRTHVTVEATPVSEIRYREHWSGRVDAKVLPAPIRVRVKPKWGDYLRLIAFEEASAELREARRSGDRDLLRAAVAKFNRAQREVGRVRFGERVTEAMAHVV